MYAYQIKNGATDEYITVPLGDPMLPQWPTAQICVQMVASVIHNGLRYYHDRSNIVCSIWRRRDDGPGWERVYGWGGVEDVLEEFERSQHPSDGSPDRCGGGTTQAA